MNGKVLADQVKTFDWRTIQVMLVAHKLTDCATLGISMIFPLTHPES
jgi:hypothetical protein